MYVKCLQLHISAVESIGFDLSEYCNVLISMTSVVEPGWFPLAHSLPT